MQPHGSSLMSSDLRCWVVLHHAPNLSLVSRSILLEEIVGVRLRGRVRVGVVQEILDAEEYLSDRDGRLPALFLVQDREAHRTGRVDVRVEEWWREFTWLALSAPSLEADNWWRRQTFGWFRGIFCKIPLR